MTQDQDTSVPTEHYQITWRGIEVQIIYHPAHGFCEGYAHLEVQTGQPRVPLPITETGYRSHFIPRGEIEDRGGPVSYVNMWLDAKAKSQAWKTFEAEMRQGRLF